MLNVDTYTVYNKQNKCLKILCNIPLQNNNNIKTIQLRNVLL